MSIFRQYLDKGVIIIPQREYRPLVKWAKYYTERPSEADLTYFESFFPDNIEYACVCGAPSGITWVEIDVDNEAAIERLRQLWKPACERFGTKGIAFAFKYSGEKTNNYGEQGEKNSPIVEVKSTGSLITIPPSRLPEKKQKENEKTKYYIFPKGDILNTELTTLPEDFEQNILSAFTITIKEPEYIPEYIPSSYSYEKTTEEEVASALGVLSADCSYADWALIGGCIWQEFQGAGFYLFDDWSATASKRYNRKDSYEQYKKGPGYVRCGIRAIFKRATDLGWSNPYHTSTDVPVEEMKVIELKDWKKSILEKKALEEVERSQSESSLIQGAPPLIKGLIEWMCATAEHPQPMLALGAVITTIGFIMGRRYELITGKRSNIYSICLAGSSEGKEHVKQASRKMLRIVGLGKNCEGSWTSGSAIEAALFEKKGEVQYITEEMGILMRGVTGKFADKNQNDALKVITDCYTTNFFQGKGYAERDKRKTIEIDTPNLSILGFSQPEIFFEALTSAEALSGLLNRCFIFQAPFLRPDENENKDILAWRSMPQNLQSGLRAMVDRHDTMLKENKYRNPEDTSPLLIPIKYDEETEYYKKSLKKTEGILFNKSKSAGDKMHLIIGRSVESMERMAIVASLGNTITMKEFLWAQKVTEYCLGLMCQASNEMIADNDFERDCNRVLKFIGEAGSVTASQLLRRFGKLKAKDLEDILTRLVRAEQVKVKGEKAINKIINHYSLAEPRTSDTSADKFALTGKSMQGAF